MRKIALTSGVYLLKQIFLWAGWILLLHHVLHAMQLMLLSLIQQLILRWQSKLSIVTSIEPLPVR
ncbi:hypothetical protein C3920_15530 [Novacetimonas pomaceti]|uniref:Uncharacterized protein n=1 Tax=Novacetimonas pomaceti TaxID=2021998 RepID=A0ABX5NY12_9PROT|nr:hypothetical protein C3920_15530 [Novacetimonas pomaceti]